MLCTFRQTKGIFHGAGRVYLTCLQALRPLANPPLRLVETISLHPFKRLKSIDSRLTPVFLASISLFLLVTVPLLTTPYSSLPATAQTTDARKTEADRLMLQGIQQYQTSQLRDVNQVSIFEGQAYTYRTLQQVRVAQNQPIAALEIAERGRARAFVDLLTERLSSDAANPVIATAPNQDQIRQIAKAQNATLVQYSIISEDFQIQGKSETRESAIYIWVIQPTGEITFRQVDLKPLWQKHNRSLASLIIGNQEFLAVRSRSTGFVNPQIDLPTLHQLLIDPIANLLPKDPNAHVIFIPLATHGLLDDVRGLGSAIALAPSGTDDGLLTAEEIFDMKLQANLVVLSACNTGEGRITGDGVIGLSRALISAGVPSVIVSLWAVPDAPTSELMQAFYQNLQSNPNKAQALRQAMLATMKTHPDPRDWAAFTLIGEAE
jgi:CHAT domain-containing protein